MQRMIANTAKKQKDSPEGCGFTRLVLQIRVDSRLTWLPPCPVSGSPECPVLAFWAGCLRGRFIPYGSLQCDILFKRGSAPDAGSATDQQRRLLWGREH